MAVLSTAIFAPALRQAGIKRLPGTGNSVDQNDELLLAINRLFNAWNIDGHKIFTTKIEQFPTVDGQLSYTIGPSANFNTARPIHITAANCVNPTDPAIYTQLDILEAEDWAKLSIRVMPAAPIYAIYYDHGLGDFASPTAGMGRIYVLGQPPDGYFLELFTWKGMIDNFTAATNEVLLPPGYLQAVVDALSLECVKLYPLEATMSAETKRQCMASIQMIKILNAKLPRMTNDAARLGGSTGTVLPASFWNNYGPGF